MRIFKSVFHVTFFLPFILLLLLPPSLKAQEDIQSLKDEIRKMREENARQQQRMQALEEKLNKLEAQSEQKTKELEEKVTAQNKAQPSASQFSSAFSRYLGSHTFMITGAAGLDYIYNQQSGAINGIPNRSQNTFVSDWEPMVLYRPTDWILFQGILSGGFGSNGTSVDLSTAAFHLFLNDYMTVVGGLFDNPFGDWYETQSPMWVNRFVTAPLPFGVEAVVPPAELGAQLRGGFQWGQSGQTFDYTIWGGNGPSFSQTSAGIDAPGATVSAPTAIASKRTNGKAVGARFRIYPLPAALELGRLELGASTYNGKWVSGEWFNSWGVDFNYFIGNFQTRGEWVQSYRQMPSDSGFGNDNRKGWYVQAGYFLSDVSLPFLPEVVNTHLQRLEPLIRFSGVNQDAVLVDDIGAAPRNTFQLGLVPDFGLSGSPALFAPHSREIALGFDYWITPSIVWQNEFDFELPRQSGSFIASDGTVTSARGSVHNDRAFLTQFTIGF